MIDVTESPARATGGPMGQATGETVPSARPPAPLESAALKRLVQKRLKRFLSLPPQVMADDDPDAVHDLRVWSRRLQQALTTLCPKPMPIKTRKLRRTLRRVRRYLGEWRNCDVMLELVAREERRTRNAERKRAWSFVREYLLEKRADQTFRARRKLLKQDLGEFADQARRLLDGPEIAADENALWEPLRAGLEATWSQWEGSLARARESLSPSDVHAFRIATKRLRYRVEMIHELGEKRLQPFIRWLKQLQDALGRWHDRQVFYQTLAEVLARPEFLLREGRTARLLLSELEKGRSRQTATLDGIFRVAMERPDKQPMTEGPGPE